MNPELQAQTDAILTALDLLHNDLRAVCMLLICAQGVVLIWGLVVLIALARINKKL